MMFSIQTPDHSNSVHKKAAINRETVGNVNVNVNKLQNWSRYAGTVLPRDVTWGRTNLSRSYPWTTWLERGWIQRGAWGPAGRPGRRFSPAAGTPCWVVDNEPLREGARPPRRRAVSGETKTTDSLWQQNKERSDVTHPEVSPATVGEGAQTHPLISPRSPHSPLILSFSLSSNENVFKMETCQWESKKSEYLPCSGPVRK